jgi:hypothetical protein
MFAGSVVRVLVVGYFADNYYITFCFQMSIWFLSKNTNQTKYLIAKIPPS